MQYVQYFDIIMIEWLASKISLLGKGYGDRKIHKNELKKVFLCRSVCIVISSIIKLKSRDRLGLRMVKLFILDRWLQTMMRSL